MKVFYCTQASLIRVTAARQVYVTQPRPIPTKLEGDSMTVM